MAAWIEGDRQNCMQREIPGGVLVEQYDKRMSVRLKMQVYKTMVRLAIIYDAETWAGKEEQVNKPAIRGEQGKNEWETMT